MLQDDEHYGFVTTMSSSRGLKGAVLWWLWFLTTWSSSIQAYNSHNTVNGIIQNPVVSCQDVKKKILCLPLEYSKFDLPYRNDHNLIDIGKCITLSAQPLVHLIKIIRSNILEPNPHPKDHFSFLEVLTQLHIENV